MPAALVEKMLEQELAHSMKQMTVAAALRTMDGDLWSQPDGESKSMLRLALPLAGKAGNQP